MHASSPACSVHALDVERLRAPHVTFVAARDEDGALLGVGALSRLSPDHAEIKSMRTSATHRGEGVGRALLDHLVAIARDEGLTRVSLETGTTGAFLPAHRLYEGAGFEHCGPFAHYTVDPHSRYYTLALT
jgi:putative acetyltransferase